MAVENDLVEIARYLIEQGARTDIQTIPSNRTAEQYIVSEDMREVFDELQFRSLFTLNKHKSPNYKNSELSSYEQTWNQPNISTASSWPRVTKSDGVIPSMTESSFHSNHNVPHRSN